MTTGGLGPCYLGDGQVEQAEEESLAWRGQVSRGPVNVAIMVAVLRLTR